MLKLKEEIRLFGCQSCGVLHVRGESDHGRTCMVGAQAERTPESCGGRLVPLIAITGHRGAYFTGVFERE